MSWVLDNLDLIWALTLDHLRQSAIAIVAGFVLAVPIGWVAFRYTRLRGPVLTVVGLLYTIPALALMPFLQLFGIPYLSELTLIVALTVYAVAIMTRSVTDGFASVSPVTRGAAVAVGFGAWRQFCTVDMPLAGPVMLAGLRVTAASTISLATVGALIGTSNLGYLFTNGAQRQIIAEVFAGVVTVVLVALVVDLILVLLGRILMPWARDRDARRTRRRQSAAPQAVTT